MDTKLIEIDMDMEFTGLRKDTTPVSIGLVANTGKMFYAEFTDYDKSQVNAWIQAEVIDKLILNDMGENSVTISEDTGTMYVRGDKRYIANGIQMWMENCFQELPIKVDIWSDCLAYDWVLFCDLFGGAQRVPSYISYIPFDICTHLKLVGLDPDVTREEFADGYIDTNGYTVLANVAEKHNSLWDAIIIKACRVRLAKCRHMNLHLDLKLSDEFKKAVQLLHMNFRMALDDNTELNPAHKKVFENLYTALGSTMELGGIENE